MRMKEWLAVATVAGTLLAGRAAAPETLPSVDLLAGRTLADFDCPLAKNAADVAATFRLVDGVLTMTGAKPLVLTTKGRWRDFELTAEIQYADGSFGDGGLAVLVGDGAPAPGLEFQLKTTDIGDLWGWPGLFVSRDAGASPMPGGGYHRLPRDFAAARTPGGWHKVAIRSVAGDVTCTWDGRSVNRCRVTAPRAGRIGFQTQPYPQGRVEMRLRRVVLTPFVERELSSFRDEAEYLRLKWRTPVADPDTGLERAEMHRALERLVADVRDKDPWCVVKAKIFAFCCDRAAIDVSPYDWFPAYALWTKHGFGHPMHPILGRRSGEVDARVCPDVPGQIDAGCRAGRWNMWKDYDHSVPDWDAILPLGFPGLAARLRAHWKDTPYYVSRQLAAEAVLRHLDRLVAQAEKRLAAQKRLPPSDALAARRAARLAKERDALKRLRTGAPRTAYDVLLFIYLDWVMSENFDAFQVRSLGNLDRLLTPYYRADLAAGRTTEAEFREQLRHFWWQWGSIGNYWGQPVYFGGTKADGTSEYNEVSRILLEIHDELALPTPKVQLKMSAGTPDWVWDKALDMARRHRSLVFCGEEPMARVLKSKIRDCTDEDCRTMIVAGCYEFGLKDGYNGTGISHVNLLKVVEELLARAKDGTFAADDFAAFKRAYLARLAETTVESRRLAYDWEKTLAEVNPSLLFSLATEYSVETGKDAFVNGTRRGNFSSVLQTGLGTAVDALLAVEEIVYVRREMSLAELGALMAANWAGREELRLRMLRGSRKWGNNDAAANRLAEEIVKAYAACLNGVPNSRDGAFEASGHCAKQFIDLGRATGATPDGRRAGEEMSKNVSPTMGADREGATALLLSVAHLDARDLPGDFPLDVMLLPSAVGGEKGLAAMKTLVQTYFANDGCAIHFNVVDGELLRDAQRHPEKYENLQVRVCGWNVRWNDLPRSEQDAYIRRAEGLVP